MRYKKHEFKTGWYMSTAERFGEFKAAVEWLIENHPPTHKYLKFLTVRFFKGDGVSFSAAADYRGIEGFPHMDSELRVSYGKNGRDPKALYYLFHEWKHLLQDDADEPADCDQAESWAEEQVPIYRRSRIHLAIKEAA